MLQRGFGLAESSPEPRTLPGSPHRLGKRGYGGSLILLDIKDRHQLGDHQQIAHLVGKVDQLQLTPRFFIPVKALTNSPSPELST